MERVDRGRVCLPPPVIPLVRTMPRIGDVVYVEAGKHGGKVGRVMGRLDPELGSVDPKWSVGGDVWHGFYVASELKILSGR